MRSVGMRRRSGLSGPFWSGLVWSDPLGSEVCLVRNVQFGCFVVVCLRCGGERERVQYHENEEGRPDLDVYICRRSEKNHCVASIVADLQV